MPGEKPAPIPPDWQLARELKLAPLYDEVYRRTSQTVHFSFSTALDAIGKRSDSPVFDPLDQTDPDILNDALRWAIVTYAVFLDRKGDVVFETVSEAADFVRNILRRDRLRAVG